jgi:hypothetical protein
LCSARLAVQCERSLAEAEISSTRDGDEKCTQNVTQKAISKEIIGDAKIDNSVLLNWIFEKPDVRMWTTFNWPRRAIDGKVFRQLSGY